MPVKSCVPQPSPHCSLARSQSHTSHLWVLSFFCGPAILLVWFGSGPAILCTSYPFLCMASPFSSHKRPPWPSLEGCGLRHPPEGSWERERLQRRKGIGSSGENCRLKRSRCQAQRAVLLQTDLSPTPLVPPFLPGPGWPCCT